MSFSPLTEKNPRKKKCRNAEGIKKTRDFSWKRNENKRQGRGGKVKARSGMLGSGNSSVRL